MTGPIRTIVALVLLSAPGLAGQECEIPGYPQPADVANLALSWCPSSVSLQVRSIAVGAPAVGPGPLMPPSFPLRIPVR